ncbi:GNAT family N-acetyltransferase [Cellulomonas humilata]|uniref:RimJ/RimL family protein N-acetyltransferase n=1 Tax=Cellulomonas humilata TaxID=144055 RepID=A0ABU0EIC5_9CELL|nr:GNAT family N-acetyltransferase [Cellulomonas humilata]MDQ0374972.1 RimJ/RimL family protein N-acetyltransferase [Cellulomonas humilata]
MPRLTTPAITPGTQRDLTQPVLDADGLRLRPWHVDDAAVVVTAYEDSDIRRWHTRSMNLDEATAWVTSWAGRWHGETGAGWALVRDGAVVGQISLRSLDHGDGRSDISYWVLPQARGRGTATAALTAVSTWAFETLGLHRIEVDHSVDNPASCRVATRAGFRLEGTKRGDALHADGWHDMHLHARVAGDVS